MGSNCWWHEQTENGLLGAVIIIMALIYSTCVAIMYSEKKNYVGDLVLGQTYLARCRRQNDWDH